MVTTQTQEQAQFQVAMQHANDIWNRLLFSLEVLEYALGEMQQMPTSYDLDKILGDLPSGRIRSEAEARLRSRDVEYADGLVQIQVCALKRCISNKQISIEEDTLWLARDYLSWIAGRAQLPWARIDDYAVAILRCIGGSTYQEVSELLPAPLDQSPQIKLSEKELLDAVHRFGVAQMLVDKKEAELKERDMKVLFDVHERGEVVLGLERLKESWQNQADILWLSNTLWPAATSQYDGVFKTEEQGAEATAADEAVEEAADADETAPVTEEEVTEEGAEQSDFEEPADEIPAEEEGESDEEAEPEKYLMKHKDEGAESDDGEPESTPA